MTWIERRIDRRTFLLGNLALATGAAAQGPRLETFSSDWQRPRECVRVRCSRASIAFGISVTRRNLTTSLRDLVTSGSDLPVDTPGPADFRERLTRSQAGTWRLQRATSGFTRRDLPTSGSELPVHILRPGDFRE